MLGHGLQCMGLSRLCVACLIKHLVINFNTSLTMERQVNVILLLLCHNIGHIWQYIMTDACQTLAHAVVISELDYDSVILYGFLNYGNGTSAEYSFLHTSE